MRTRIALVVLVLVPLAASAAVDTLWSRRWSGAGRHDDGITQIACDRAGFVYTTGIGWDSTVNHFTMVTAKYDSWGGQKWRTSYTSFATADTFVAIARDMNGDIYVAGTVNNPARGREIRTVKYNGNSGSPLWTAGYNALADLSDDFLVALTYDSVNNYLYVCGTSYNGDDRKYDYALVRYDPGNGSQVWATLYNWPMTGRYGDDVATGMCLGLNRDPVVTGYSYDNSDAVSDWQTVRFSRVNGDSAAGWSAFGRGRMRSDPGNDEEWPFAVCADANGNIYDAGFTYNNVQGYYNLKVARHTPSGDTTRSRRYSAGDDASWAKGVRFNGFDRLFVHGHFYDAADEMEYSCEDWGVLVFDTTRTLGFKWAQFHDGGYLGFDEPWDMAIDAEGRAYVAGQIEEGEAGRPTWQVLRYDTTETSPSLDLKYIPAPVPPDTQPRDTFDNVAWSIAMTDTNNIYVGGYINRWNQAGAGWDQDMTVARFGVDAPLVTLDSVVPQVDTVDSGTTVAWRAWYHNGGQPGDSLPIHHVRPVLTLEIGGGYTSTVTDTVGAWPAQVRSVQFPLTWTALQRGVNFLRCTLSWNNNASTQSQVTRNLFVRVRDVGPTLVTRPADSVNQGPVVAQARVQNFGNANETVDAVFVLGADSAFATATVNAGSFALVDFAPPLTPGLGGHPIRVYTRFGADVKRSNDTLRDTTTVYPGIVDVACQRIVAPAGPVNEGTVLSPRAWVRNFGGAAVTFMSYFWIDNGLDGAEPPKAAPIDQSNSGAANPGRVSAASSSSARSTKTTAAMRSYQPVAPTDAIVYLDSVATTLQPAGLPGDSVLLSFPNWTATPFGNYTTKCSTGLTADENPGNDRKTGTCTIQSLDVQTLSIDAPLGSVDLGTEVIPRATVQNNGNTTQTFWVKFKIGDSYVDSTATVVTAGMTRAVSFERWTAGPAGVCAISCSTKLAGDGLPDNDRLTDSIFVARHEVGAVAILYPVGNLDSGAVTPRVRVQNNGNQEETFMVFFRIPGEYYDSVAATVPSGELQDVTFGSSHTVHEGYFTTRCSVFIASDAVRSNDTCSGWFHVNRHDVAVDTILAPSGAMPDTAIVPRVSVLNYGDVAETFKVHFTVDDGYAESTQVLVGQGAGCFATFPAWYPDEGWYWVTCSTALRSDIVHDNDVRAESVFIFTHDVAATAILAPTREILPGPVTPQVRLHNNGKQEDTVKVFFRIGGAYYDSAAVAVPAWSDMLASFTSWNAVIGNYATRCSLYLPGDAFAVNDTLAGLLRVWDHDVGVVAIVEPFDTVDAGLMTPAARMRNYGPVTETFTAFFSIGGTSYVDSQEVTLDAGRDSVVRFRDWESPVGEFTTTCSTRLATDTIRYNRVAYGWFTALRPIYPGWEQMASVPAGGRSKGVKDGGSLAFDLSNSVYALKGNGRLEFYRYTMSSNTWATAETVPAIGRAGRKKVVKKGATLVFSDGRVFATKGNNSVEFWQYTPAGGAVQSEGVDEAYPWTQLADVPFGARAVREGTGTAAVKLGDTSFIYLLKGSNTTEFYRYNIGNNSWQSLAPAPLGYSGKPFKKGSGIAFIRTSDSLQRPMIYALKGNYNEFFRYEVDSNRWSMSNALPFYGASGRKKRAKDGAGLATLVGSIWVLKGNNTTEFWQYKPDSYLWIEEEEVPIGAGKRVKGGGALVSAGRSLFALKGNNTLEFYQYEPTGFVTGARAPDRSAALGQGQATKPLLLTVGPNPLTAASMVSYSVPRPGSISLRLYDITGQLAATLVQGPAAAGGHAVPVGRTHLARGVYVLKLETGTSTETVKLVVE